MNSVELETILRKVVREELAALLSQSQGLPQDCQLSGSLEQRAARLNVLARTDPEKSKEELRRLNREDSIRRRDEKRRLKAAA